MIVWRNRERLKYAEETRKQSLIEQYLSGVIHNILQSVGLQQCDAELCLGPISTWFPDASLFYKAREAHRTAIITLNAAHRAFYGNERDVFTNEEMMINELMMGSGDIILSNRGQMIYDACTRMKTVRLCNIFVEKFLIWAGIRYEKRPITNVLKTQSELPLLAPREFPGLKAFQGSPRGLSETTTLDTTQRTRPHTIGSLEPKYRLDSARASMEPELPRSPPPSRDGGPSHLYSPENPIERDPNSQDPSIEKCRSFQLGAQEFILAKREQPAQLTSLIEAMRAQAHSPRDICPTTYQ